MAIHIAVVGAGAWGAALAVQATRVGASVTLWARNPDRAVAPDRRPVRLPSVTLPRTISVTGTLPRHADLFLLAVPVQHLRPILGAMTPDGPLVACCKGVELGSGLLPGEIIASIHPHLPRAVLSGPNFADGIAAGAPAASVIASSRPGLAETLCGTLAGGGLRLYASDDPIGVEAGGAIKNVVAIAAGIAIGAGYGENARAALMTRGLSELSRITVALGGHRETAAGLSGLGDLVLTCTGQSSRNFSLGHELGRGRTISDILAERITVAEGVCTAFALRPRLRQHHLTTPLCDTVSAILDGSLDLEAAKAILLSRPLGTE